MSEISQLLREQAEQITEQLEKQAEQVALFEQTTLAAAEALVEAGVSPEDSLSMVKQAEELKDLAPLPVTIEPQFVVTVLEKSASYIEELEGTIADLQVKIKNSEGFSKAAAISGPDAENLQSYGFSNDQVKIMADTGILEKMAHITGSPWEMGHSSGSPTADSLDPIERFCLGR
jgi:hypothetical protein